MREELFKMERKGLVTEGQEVKVTERINGSLYSYLVEPSVAMSGIYRSNQRIKSKTGIINEILMNTHLISQPINFFAHESYFWPIVAFANVWKETGWNAIIYLAAITSIDPSLYEAAAIDGATWWKRVWNITIPGMLPIIMLPPI